MHERARTLREMGTTEAELKRLASLGITEATWVMDFETKRHHEWADARRAFIHDEVEAIIAKVAARKAKRKTVAA